MNEAPRDIVESFERHRRYLTGFAYRMLGSLAEAQDIVQEAYLRWHRASHDEIADARAFLSRIVARLCLDQLKSARTRHEQYVGSWLPEPILDDAALATDCANDFAQDLSVALMLTLERLSPLERASFLLHDVFDLSFDEVALTLRRSPASCRQLATRARSRVRAARPRFRPAPQECERLVAAFGVAAQRGDPSALAELLTEDVTFYSDADGKTPAARRPISGRVNVIRLIQGLARKGASEISAVRFAPINGLPGLILERGATEVLTLAFDFSAGRIANLYLMLNPDKLRHIPPPHLS
jgi:RNA polymerase sigma-70 factor (ECF subfamily)